MYVDSSYMDQHIYTDKNVCSSPTPNFYSFKYDVVSIIAKEVRDCVTIVSKRLKKNSPVAGNQPPYPPKSWGVVRFAHNTVLGRPSLTVSKKDRQDLTLKKDTKSQIPIILYSNVPIFSCGQK